MNGFKRLKQEGLLGRFVLAVSLIWFGGFLFGFIAALNLT